MTHLFSASLGLFIPRTRHPIVYFLDYFPEKLLVIQRWEPSIFWNIYHTTLRGPPLLAFPFSKSIHIHCFHPAWVDMLIYFLKDFYQINTQGCHWTVLFTCTLGNNAQGLICICEHWWIQKETLGWSPSPLAWRTGSSWKDQWITQGTSSEHMKNSERKDLYSCFPASAASAEP